MDESGWRTDERTDSIRCVTRFGTSGRSFPCPCTCNLSRLLVFNLASFLQFIRNYTFMNILRTNFHHIHISIMRHFYFWIIVVKKKTLEKNFFFFFFENMECGKEIFYREFSTRSDEKYFEKIFFFFNYFLNFFLYRIYLKQNRYLKN